MIRTRELTRTFSRGHGKGASTVEAVRGVDLDVGQGEMVALLGPNGAGKSTTLRMLTTLLRPTSGTAVVAGCDIDADPADVRANIGYIGQGNGAAQVQRVRDEVVMQGRVYGLDRADARRRADELLDSLQLSSVAERLVSTLSGGQQRRLDIALGMVHRPELLFLDEPSTGLDPQNRANLQLEIERLRVEHGTTIVLTTHYLDEADALADRVIVIDHGSIIADDTPERLKAELAGDRVRLVMSDVEGATAAAQALHRAGPCRDLEVRGVEVVARTNGGAEALPAVLVALDRADHRVRSAEAARPTLDDVFLALTGRSLREGVDDPTAIDPGATGASPDPAPRVHATEPATTEHATTEPATTDLTELQR